MEVIKSGLISSISPPAPEADNPLSVTEALSVINSVLLNYRGFDKLRQALATAQQLEDSMAERNKALDDLNTQIDATKSSLANVKGQVTRAQGDRDRVLIDIQTAKDAAVVAQAQAETAFQAGLEQRKQDFEAELQEQAQVAQVNLEDRIAGLKREFGGLQKQVAEAQATLDTLTPQISDKKSLLAATEQKLADAQAALDAIKARL